jgi:hypothetical protein
MKLRLGCVVFAFFSLVLSMSAQTTSGNTVATTAAAATTAQVPRLVKFSGMLKGVPPESVSNGIVLTPGAAPTSVVAITLSLYAEQSGGAPLWSEVQNVHVDTSGHYTVQLGASKAEGLPLDLFASAQAQWLGVQLQGQAEQPRVMLLSVPYALKAADAETFGGKPPSAFMPASGSEANSAANRSGLNNNVKNEHPLTLTGSGTTDYIPLWTNASNLTSSVIFQSSGHEIGIGTSNPVTPLEVDGNNSISIVGVTQTGSAGSAIAGDVIATSGNGFGVTGSTASPAGTGVVGVNTATTGRAVGVAGASGSPTGTGVLGQNENTTGVNFGVSGTSASPTGVGVIGQNSTTSGAGFGVVGNSSSSGGIGVSGNASSTTGVVYGVQGTTPSPQGIGVYGENTSTTGFAIGVSGTNDSTSGIGVLGTANATTGAAFGVKGTTASSAGVGVYGVATPTTGVNYGVEGTNASVDGIGVFGTATDTTGVTSGVIGSVDSTEGTGVYGVGVSPSVEGGSVVERPIGVWGDTDQDGAGVVGSADNGIGVAGYNKAPSIATADFQNDETTRIDTPVLVTRGTHFDGFCLIDVSGNLACIGSKSAVVPVDGGARKVALYAVEAPENWFEDAGSARLAHGSAVVHLEPIFAQTVNSSVEYHVFLTPNGDCKGLYVTSKSADSFEVHELGGGVSSIAFDYRIMAHRKGYEAIRLADNTERFARLERKGPPVARPHVAPARNTTTAATPRPVARVRTPLPYVMQAPVVVKKKDNK